MHETVGFDCEFLDSINFVALLGTPYCSYLLPHIILRYYTLLLDIPALAVTRDGCDALKATVGKMFTRSSDERRVIGFARKDDINVLRASSWRSIDSLRTITLTWRISGLQLLRRAREQHFGLYVCFVKRKRPLTLFL